MFARYKLTCPTTFGQIQRDDSYTLGPKNYTCCPTYNYCQSLPKVNGCPPCSNCCPKLNYYDDNDEEIINKQMEYFDNNVY